MKVTYFYKSFLCCNFVKTYLILEKMTSIFRKYNLKLYLNTIFDFFSISISIFHRSKLPRKFCNFRHYVATKLQHFWSKEYRKSSHLLEFGLGCLDIFSSILIRVAKELLSFLSKYTLSVSFPFSVFLSNTCAVTHELCMV